MTELTLSALFKRSEFPENMEERLQQADKEEVRAAVQTLFSLRQRFHQTDQPTAEGVSREQFDFEERMRLLGRKASCLDQELALEIGLSGQQPEAVMENQHLDAPAARKLLNSYMDKFEQNIVQHGHGEQWDGVVARDLLEFMESSLQAYAQRFQAPLGKLTNRILAWCKQRRRNAPSNDLTTPFMMARQLEACLLKLPVEVVQLGPEELWEWFQLVDQTSPGTTFQQALIATNARAGPRLWQHIMEHEPSLPVVRALSRHQAFVQTQKLRQAARKLGDPDVHLYLLGHLQDEDVLAEMFMELVELNPERAAQAWFSPRMGEALQAALSQEQLRQLLTINQEDVRRSALRQLGCRFVDSSSGRTRE